MRCTDIAPGLGSDVLFRAFNKFLVFHESAEL